MNRYHILTAVIGLIICISYAIGFDAAATVLPDRVSTKLTTAICLLLMPSLKREHLSLLASLSIAGCVSVSLAAYYVGQSYGGGVDVDRVVLSVAPGVPSLGTAACFAAGILSQYGGFTVTRSVAIAMAVISSIALVGNLVQVDVMIYHFPGISTGMAIPTSLAFLFWSAGELKTK